jgi:hypothetical protein
MSGLKITAGLSPVMMTSQIQFGLVIPHFWPVKMTGKAKI